MNWIDNITKRTITKGRKSIVRDVKSKNNFSEFDIKLVEKVDSWAQEHNKELDNQFSFIFSKANTGSEGWRGIAKNEPDIFNNALKISKKYEMLVR